MVTGFPGATVVGLDRARSRRLAAGMVSALETGHVFAEVDGIDSVEEWRAAARSVGRAHGWRVRTGITTDGARVWAARLDRELTEAEQRRADEQVRYLGASLRPRRPPVRRTRL